MSTTAFGARRVTESLKAIAKYLDDGAQIAAGVSPGSVLVPDPTPIPRTAGPRLTSVLWQPANSRVLNLSPGNTTKLSVSVTGSNLTNVVTLKLVSGEAELVASTLTAPTDVSFTALFDETSAQPGSYDAFVIDSATQTFLLQNALRVETHDDAKHGGGSSGSVGVSNGPRLTNVLWQGGTPVLKRHPRSTEPHTVVVKGSNLNRVQTFELVSGEAHYVAKKLQHVSDTSLNAYFDDIPAQPQSYDAWVVDAAGQSFERPNALLVERHDATTSPYDNPAPPQSYDGSVSEEAGQEYGLDNPASVERDKTDIDESRGVQGAKAILPSNPRGKSTPRKE